MPRGFAAGLLHFLLWAPCSGLYDAEKHVHFIRLYGNIDQYAYYYLDLLIGTPPQRVSVIVDTGSGIAAFPCTKCAHCGVHIDPLFNYSLSSTAEWQLCDSQKVCACKDGKCVYHQGYTEGSSVSGSWFQDLVRIGDAFEEKLGETWSKLEPAVLARMGCHNDENKLFYTQKANGILGIAPSSRGNNILQEVFARPQGVNAKVFSICLSESGGQLVVGGHNESAHVGPVQQIPLKITAGYYVRLTGFGMAGKVLSKTDTRQAMIDSGTTYTYTDTVSYHALRAAIEGHCKDNDECGGAKLSGRCWTIPDGAKGLDRFPDIDTIFGDAKVVWKPKAYLYHSRSSRKWCYGFENDGSNAKTTLGATWMKHQDLIFNMDKSLVEVAPARCPSYSLRPVHKFGFTGTAGSRTQTPAEHPVTGKTTKDSSSDAQDVIAAANATVAAHSDPPTQQQSKPAANPSPQSQQSPPQQASEPVAKPALPSQQSSEPVANTAANTAAPVVTVPSAQPPSKPSTNSLEKHVVANDLNGSFLIVFMIAGLTIFVLVVMYFRRKSMWRKARKKHKYAKQADDQSHSSGMPPEIVGSADGNIADANVFAIEDPDQWNEDDFNLDAKDVVSKLMFDRSPRASPRETRVFEDVFGSDFGESAAFVSPRPSNGLSSAGESRSNSKGLASDVMTDGNVIAADVGGVTPFRSASKDAPS